MGIEKFKSIRLFCIVKKRECYIAPAIIISYYIINHLERWSLYARPLLHYPRLLSHLPCNTHTHTQARTYKLPVGTILTWKNIKSFLNVWILKDGKSIICVKTFNGGSAWLQRVCQVIFFPTGLAYSRRRDHLIYHVDAKTFTAGVNEPFVFSHLCLPETIEIRSSHPNLISILRAYHKSRRHIAAIQ